MFFEIIFLLLSWEIDHGAIDATIYSEKSTDLRGPISSFHGTAPSLTADSSRFQLTFSSGDSIFYTYSDIHDVHFVDPVPVAIVKGLVSVGGRGPEIITTRQGLLIAAPDDSGDIHTFLKATHQDNWAKGGIINELSGVAREAFVSLACNTDGDVYAVWLDLRADGHNKIAGAKSIDGGMSWSKNQIIYRSPDSTVCECCKPTVALNGAHVAVMFRNWIDGNRDLYVIQSFDGGARFGNATKLGKGSWKLNGCPMDGGNVLLDASGDVHTVWRRKGEVFECQTGKEEKLIGEGMHCIMAGQPETRVIAFMNKGQIYLRKQIGAITKLGEGERPALVISGQTALCAWEQNGNIAYRAIPN